jgi:hypothetical protein
MLRTGVREDKIMPRADGLWLYNEPARSKRALLRTTLSVVLVCVEARSARQAACGLRRAPNTRYKAVVYHHCLLNTTHLTPPPPSVFTKNSRAAGLPFVLCRYRGSRRFRRNRYNKTTSQRKNRTSRPIHGRMEASVEDAGMFFFHKKLLPEFKPCLAGRSNVI